MLRDCEDLAVIGLTEVLANLNTIRAAFQATVSHIRTSKPDAVVLIDYPGFNLRLAKRVHEMGIPVIYYICPQIWAWKTARVHKLAEYCEKLLVVFGFEKDFIESFGYEAVHVGHPLLDLMDFEASAGLREELTESGFLTGEEYVVGVLPGSRREEVRKLAGLFARSLAKVAESGLNIKTISAAAPAIEPKSTEQLFTDAGIKSKVFQGRAHEVMAASDLLLAASGTATLEAALFATPTIVCYKTSALNAAIGRCVMKVNWLSLPNLIFRAEVVPELLQSAANVHNVSSLAQRYLEDESLRKDTVRRLARTRELLGGRGASERAAEQVLDTLRRA